MNEKHIWPVSNLKQVEETFINEKSNKPDSPKMTQTYFDATCAYFITEMPNYDCKKRENKKKIYNLKEDVHNQCLT